MTPQRQYTKASTQTDQSIRDEPSGFTSPVPPILNRLFDRSARKQAGPMPLGLFAPADWPPCPVCADRLLAVAVVTDATDELVAAAMECYNPEHTPTRYVYNVVTDTIYATKGRSELALTKRSADDRSLDNGSITRTNTG